MRWIFIGLMLCAIGAFAQETPVVATPTIPEPGKADFLLCVSLMEKASTQAMLATSNRDRVDVLKRQLAADECLVELEPRISDQERLAGFQKLERIWSVAMRVPSATATAQYIMSAQKFMMSIDE